MIIGICGYARTGKDTAAKYLAERYGFERRSFADPLRNALYTLNPRISHGGIRYREAVDYWGYEKAKDLYADIRHLLQRLGTDVGREMWGEDFWVERMAASTPEDSDIVIPDVRFLNEARFIGERGVLLRMHRPGHGPVNDHPSETALDDYSAERVVWIHNDGTVEDLHGKIDTIMERLLV